MNATRLLPIVLAAACGRAPAPAPVGNGGGVASTTSYAALFEHGRTWTFELEHERWDDPDPGSETATTTGTATCWVARVVEIQGGKASTIACVGLDGGPVSGVWIVDGGGLRRAEGVVTADDRWSNVCLDDRGFTHGSWGWSRGRGEATTFTLARTN